MEEREADLLKGLSLEQQAAVKEQARVMAASRAEAFVCAARGDAEGLRAALSRGGTDAGARDSEGRSVLEIAAAGGHVSSVVAVLEGRPSLARERGPGGRTALHAASQADAGEVVRVLVNKFGAEVEAGDGRGSTALHWAARRGAETAAEVLAEAGASLSATTDEGWTPLHLAVEAGHTSLATRLAARGGGVDRPDKSGVTPLRLAVNTGNAAVTEYFLSRCTDDAPRLVAGDVVSGVSLLDLAVLRKHSEVVEVLLRHGARATARTLSTALKDGSLRLLRVCAEQKMPGIPQSALYVACKKGDMDLARLLALDCGLKIDESCVKLATESGDAAMLRWARSRFEETHNAACAACGKSDTKLMRCGKCKLVKYCSVACQKADQQQHSPLCKPPPPPQ